MAYVTEVVEWLADIDDDAAEFVEECSQYANGEPIDSCSSTGTVFFTSNNQTETVRLAPIVASATAAAGGDDRNNNAAHNCKVGLTGAMAAAVGALGVIMTL